jgi:thiol-disulfide isomerase/thioredoxin
MRNDSGLIRTVALSALFSVALIGGSAFSQEPKSVVAKAKPAAEPAHRVAAIYFHRTNRCATCKKISAYIEETVQAGFAKELKGGQVSVSMIDFQDEKNKAYTEAYKITGPTMVVADVHTGKVTVWKSSPKAWTLVRDKDAFFKYVQDEVRGYLEAK